jgi:hypothetical protein
MNICPQKTDIASRIIEGQAFIVNTKTSTLHELDETGTFIWKLIEKGRTLENIVLELSSFYEVTEARAMKDAKDFLDELSAKGLISFK